MARLSSWTGFGLDTGFLLNNFNCTLCILLASVCNEFKMCVCAHCFFQDGWITALDGRCVLGAVVRPHLLLSISQQTSISHQSGHSPQNSNSSRFKVFSFSSTSWSEVRCIQKSEVFKCQKYSSVRSIRKVRCQMQCGMSNQIICDKDTIARCRDVRCWMSNIKGQPAGVSPQRPFSFHHYCQISTYKIPEGRLC